MKVLWVILILAGALYLFRQLLREFETAKREETPARQTAPARPGPSSSASLPGLPPALEPALAEAQQKGADGLGNFLARYGQVIRDPKLAAIELDYATLLTLKNPEEARRVFESVKQRTLSSSPVHERIKSLEKTFQ